MVRPIVEYASPVWSPSRVRDIKLVEGIQRRATKLLDLKEMSYENRLIKINLPTLEFRRIRTDLIQVFNIFIGLDRINCDKLFNKNPFGRTRGHLYKIEKKYCRLNLRKEFFAVRIIDMWNALPSHVVEADNINIFKARLEKYLSNDPWRFIPSFMG